MYQKNSENEGVTPIPEKYMDRFSVGSVVWAKFGKTRWWPGLVIAGTMVEQETKEGHVWMYWVLDGRLSQLLAERTQTDVSSFDNIEEWVTEPGGFFHVMRENPKQTAAHQDIVIDDLKKIQVGKERELVKPIKRKYQDTCDDKLLRESLTETCLACHHGCSVDIKHPLFQGYLCQSCKPTLKKTLFSVDYDDCTLTCVVCGDGGFLAICDDKQCGRSFCFGCIEYHKGHAMAKKIEKEEGWHCFLCQENNGDGYGGLIPRQDRKAEIIEFYTDFPLCTDLRYLTNAGKRRIRVLSLFDGIGTGRVALEESGLDVEVYYSSEVDVKAKQVTRHNFKDEIVEIGDALLLNQEKIRELCPIDLVIAGPPCNDLSIVNPGRKGFNGTGMLLVKFFSLLRDVEDICKRNTHVFWMMENTGSLPNAYKGSICSYLGMESSSWDAKHFSGQRRVRNFWGNIPGMYSTPDVLKQLESEKKNLSSVLTPNHNRTARVECTRTITSQPNSLTITNKENNKLITMNGVEVDLWIEEIERLFGFKTNYTQAAGLTNNERRGLLGRAWSVPVVKQIIKPLTNMFKMKDSK